MGSECRFQLATAGTLGSACRFQPATVMMFRYSNIFLSSHATSRFVVAVVEWSRLLWLCGVKARQFSAYTPRRNFSRAQWLDHRSALKEGLSSSEDVPAPNNVLPRPTQQQHDAMQDVRYTASTQVPQSPQVEATNENLGGEESGRQPSLLRRRRRPPQTLLLNLVWTANRTSSCHV